MHNERGFLLMDVIIVTAIIVIALASAGTLFLGNVTPAVAAATIDIAAAIDETRATAIAFDTATVVFAPGANGRGFSARIYEGAPGDAGFRPRNGPVHESSAATVSETAAPLGIPGFALRMDRRGNVSGFRNFSASDTAFTPIACPATTAFQLRVDDRRESRIVAVPCTLTLSSTTAQTVATPQPALTATPHPAGTCPATSPCTPMPIAPAFAVCPNGFAPDTSAPGICDPIATSTCPPNGGGTPPVCIVAVNPEPTAGASALPLFPVAITGCGMVETSDVGSVSTIQQGADGAFVTYADAFGSTATHVCSAHDA